MKCTQQLAASIKELAKNNNEDYSSEDIVAFLNNPDTFRDFGEGLKLLTRKYMPGDYIGSEEAYLKEKANEKGISLNRNTVKSWYQGIRPKKGEQSREHMYKISFTLGLNVEDTIYLFKSIYLDKPFNMRSVNEFIYFYCIKNGRNYQNACELIGQVIENASADYSDATIYTRFIGQSANEISSDEEIVEYICSHQHNFSINNRSAAEELEKLVNQIRATDEDELAWKNNIVRDDDSSKSYIIREIARTSKYEKYEKGKNSRDNCIVLEYKSITSIETMLDVITGFIRGRSKDRSGKSIFVNDSFPKEITNRFPAKKSFSTKPEDISSEELRKMIILLYSYKYWFNKQYLGNKEDELDDYLLPLDSLLQRCSLQTMYYGNPFDWLFLYCTLNEAPLACFRDILAEGDGAW